MHVTDYLKQHGLAKLQEEFAIKAKEYPDDGLIVLNYDQIYSSPKANPTIMECRGLILDYNFNVVSRSFDRFFNLGEQPDTQTHIDISKAICHEKIDGSLIKIYYHKDTWHVSTRGTAFAESDVNGFGVTFKELALKALGMNDEDFQDACSNSLATNNTYICEIVCAENRVVKRYNGYTLYYLAARDNSTFEYKNYYTQCLELGMKPPETYKFDSVEHCIETAKHLKDLDEGYVLYQDGVPCAKIKSPMYVAIHNIRGEGLTPKRIAQIVLTGECDEYLKYFPEDESFFTPYFESHKNLNTAMAITSIDTFNIEDQKTFALAVKDKVYSAVMFTMKKKKISYLEAFEQQTEASKIRMLEAYLESA